METSMEQAIGFRIDRSVQLVVFRAELDHRLVNRDVIQICSLNRL